LDATLSSSRPKPTVSRFKADRIASSHAMSPPSSSISMGPSILPASSYKSLQRAVRTGRLENDTLVGGDAGESSSEPEDENSKAVLDLLKLGEVHNIGPILNPTTSLASGKAISSPLSPRLRQAAENGDTLDPTSKPKVSQFKLNRAQDRRVSHEQTSLPSLASTSQPSSSPILPPTLTQFPTVIDSPSFPRQTLYSSMEAQPGIPTASSGRRPDRPPTVMSAAVLESTADRTGGRVIRTERRQEKKVSRFLAERM